MSIDSLPADIKRDIYIAKEIISAAGAKEIYLFGSIAEGTFSADSDLDIAIIGLSKEKFFKVYGELLSKLSRSVDIIGLDYRTDFSKEIQKTGNLIRVA